MTTYLKVIGADNKAVHRGVFDYTDYLPDGDNPGQWLPERDVEMCKSGWHFCDEESLMRDWAKANMQVFEVEIHPAFDGPDKGKICARSGRLLRPYALPQWWQDAMVFIESLQDIPWLRPDGEPDPDWKLFELPSWSSAYSAARSSAYLAARSVAGEAARSAARSAAYLAAYLAARSVAGEAAYLTAYSAARSAARSAAYLAAYLAARSVAGEAARSAAGEAAGEAAYSAGLYVSVCHICNGLEIAAKHIEFAQRQWEVWRKGYGLAGDIDGVLYVYAAESEVTS